MSNSPIAKSQEKKKWVQRKNKFYLPITQKFQQTLFKSQLKPFIICLGGKVKNSWHNSVQNLNEFLKFYFTQKKNLFLGQRSIKLLLLLRGGALTIRINKHKSQFERTYCIAHEQHDNDECEGFLCAIFILIFFRLNLRGLWNEKKNQTKKKRNSVQVVLLVRKT